MSLFAISRRISATSKCFPFVRQLSTLASNPHIKIFPSSTPNSHILTLLPTNPPTPSLALGTTTSIPPTPASFTENPRFLAILTSVLEAHAHRDSGLQSQARALAGPGGASFLGPLSSPRRNTGAGSGRGPNPRGPGGDGAGGASAQGGAGGAGRGGFVHLSDMRHPPDFGRIAWPEDIMGSVQVDGNGEIVGRLQPSGTYRLVTNEGILGLSDFLVEKLVRRLEEEENKEP